MKPQLPDFMIIGAARSGTSSLHQNLLQHPKIQGPSKFRIHGNNKEVHFFDKKYKQGLGFYQSCWDKRKEGCLLMESTPNYLYIPRVPGLVKQDLPSCKFIVMLRNPIRRAWSHYYHWNKLKPWARLKMEFLKDPNHEIIKKGIYIDQIKKWHGHFSMKQFLIVRSEDFYGNPERVIQKVFEWLDLDPIHLEQIKYFDPAYMERRKAPDKYPSMPLSTHKWMKKFYKPHNERLGEYFNFNFGWD